MRAVGGALLALPSVPRAVVAIPALHRLDDHGFDGHPFERGVADTPKRV
jgi:hypothetical protein